jgi:GAF domain-containing protein
LGWINDNKRLKGEILLFDQIIAFAVAYLDGCCGWLYLVENSAEELYCEVFYNVGMDPAEGIEKSGKCIATQALSQGEMVITPQDEKRNKSTPPKPVNNSLTLVGVPIIHLDETKGVLVVGRDSQRPDYSPEELNQLQLFTEQIALLIENETPSKVSQNYSYPFEVLNQLASELVLAEDLQGLAEIFTSRMKEVLPADACYFVLKGTSRAESPVVVYTPFEDEGSLEGSLMGHVETVRRILAAGSIIPIDDGNQADVLVPEIVEMLGIHSALAFPLVIRNWEMGAGVLIFHSPHSFTREEILICEQAIHLLTFALDQMRISKDGQRRREVYEALRKANIRLTSSLDLETILDSILRQALTLVGADDVHIFLYDEGQLSFAGAQWSKASSSEPYSELRESGITYSVARSGEMIVTTSVDKDPLFENWQWGGAIVSLPLSVGEQVIGVMNVAFEQPHDFIEEELWVLEMLATQAAFALQNANLFHQLNLDKRRIQVLFDVTNTLVTELDDDRILQLSIDLITKHFDAALGEAFSYEKSTERIHLGAISGATDLSVDELDSALGLVKGKGLEGWVVEHKKSLAVFDVQRDDRWQGVDGIHDGIKSNLCAPIVLGKDILGVLSVFYKGEAGSDHLDLLNAVSQQVGLALSNAKKYHQIERRVAELSALQHVAKTINRRLDTEQLLQEVVDQVHQVLGYEIVAVYLIEEDWCRRISFGSDSLIRGNYWTCCSDE